MWRGAAEKSCSGWWLAGGGERVCHGLCGGGRTPDCIEQGVVQRIRILNIGAQYDPEAGTPSKHGQGVSVIPREGESAHVADAL